MLYDFDANTLLKVTLIIKKSYQDFFFLDLQSKLC